MVKSISRARPGRSCMFIFLNENFFILVFNDISQNETVLTQISLVLLEIISLLFLLKLFVFNVAQINVWVSNR